MNIDLLNKISNATIYGYYDPSLKLVTVWFYNSGKANVVAYLMKDMRWDIREITDERSKLFEDKEIITISHKPIEKQTKNSEFDQVVRSALNKSLEEAEASGKEKSANIELMKIVLDNNSYDNINN